MGADEGGWGKEKKEKRQRREIRRNNRNKRRYSAKQCDHIPTRSEYLKTCDLSNQNNMANPHIHRGANIDTTKIW